MRKIIKLLKQSSNDFEYLMVHCCKVWKGNASTQKWLTVIDLLIYYDTHFD